MCQFGAKKKEARLFEGPLLEDIAKRIKSAYAEFTQHWLTLAQNVNVQKLRLKRAQHSIHVPDH